MKNSAYEPRPVQAPVKIAIFASSTGATTYDATRWAQPPAAEMFDSVTARVAEKRGRGQVYYLQTSAGEAVLRHYQRGGLVARFCSDWYFWQGAELTRPFREFRLTANLFSMGLPVPRPLAARYVRTGFGYRADLMTARIPNAMTLAELLHEAPELIAWPAIGRLIACFHQRGLWHADLNAHNILIDGNETIWLIDFDRGELRELTRDWPLQNLQRLKRSLLKLGADRLASRFESAAWADLLDAYRGSIQFG